MGSTPARVAPRSVSGSWPPFEVALPHSHSGTRFIPIRRLVRSVAFGPAQIREIVYVDEDALAELDLTDRSDPATELVAHKVLECAVAGEIDRKSLRERTLAAFKADAVSTPLVEVN